LFLPALTSHVLQPSDLSVFAPLKSRYRSEITALASLDDASPVKKQSFAANTWAHKGDICTSSITCRLAGSKFSPHNPSKGLNSSQVQGSKPLQVTPPQCQERHPIFGTQRALNIFTELLNRFVEDRARSRHYTKLYPRLPMRLTILTQNRSLENTATLNSSPKWEDRSS
jgi:hypothetical protein